MLIPDLPYRRGREGFSDDFLRKSAFPDSYPPIDRRKSRRRRMRSSPNWYLNFRNGSLVAINRHVSGSGRNEMGACSRGQCWTSLRSILWYGAYKATYPSLRFGSSGLGCDLNPPKWPGGLGQNFVREIPQYIGFSKTPIARQKNISEPSV